MLENLRHPITGEILFGALELCCSRTGTGHLAKGFGDRLVALRVKVNEPLIVTSCCRSAQHNRAIGGNPRSFHVYDKPFYLTGGTCAVDVVRKDGAYAALLVRWALDLGWSVGVAKTFIHLDRRIDYTTLPQVLYSY